MAEGSDHIAGDTVHTENIAMVACIGTVNSLPNQWLSYNRDSDSLS